MNVTCYIFLFFLVGEIYKCLVYVQDKILQSTGRGQNVTVTNDGATILESLHIDNPAPKVLIGILLFERTDHSHAKILLIHNCQRVLKLFNFSANYFLSSYLMCKTSDAVSLYML
jgi:hypothetical protein